MGDLFISAKGFTQAARHPKLKPNHSAQRRKTCFVKNFPSYFRPAGAALLG
jgi:hypothetical protein